MNLIEKLQARRDQFNGFSRHEVFDKNDLADAVQTCIDIVKQHSDWVLVSERLPGESGEYLVYCVGDVAFAKNRRARTVMVFNAEKKYVG